VDFSDRGSTPERLERESAKLKRVIPNAQSEKRRFGRSHAYPEQKLSPRDTQVRIHSHLCRFERIRRYPMDRLAYQPRNFLGAKRISEIYFSIFPEKV